MVAATMKYAYHANSRGLTPEYSCWFAMKRRCLNPRGHTWKRYGGRAVSRFATAGAIASRISSLTWDAGRRRSIQSIASTTMGITRLRIAVGRPRANRRAIGDNQ
jgi:hypothetical protein